MITEPLAETLFAGLPSASSGSTVILTGAEMQSSPHSDQNWLYLPPSQSLLHGLRDLAEISHQGSRFSKGIVLAKGNKIVMLSCQQSADILCRASQRVIGGYGDKHRPLRRWLFAAMVTGVSAMEWASFARVFPVQGAIIKMSSHFFGPIGST